MRKKVPYPQDDDRGRRFSSSGRPRVFYANQKPARMYRCRICGQLLSKPPNTYYHCPFANRTDT